MPTEAQTDPFEAPRAQAEGPEGFIEAVRRVLEELGTGYRFGPELPEELLRAKDREGPGGKPRRSFEKLSPCVVYRWNRYPAIRQGPGLSDAPSGRRMQRKPDQIKFHSRPTPDFEGDQVPLWESKKSVPPFIREDVMESGLCAAAPWIYDVFVHFGLFAPTPEELFRMHRTLMMVLRLCFDRAMVGESNLAGWFWADESGAPSGIKPPEGMPARTLSWVLKQDEVYAFPADRLEEITLDLHDTKIQ